MKVRIERDAFADAVTWAARTISPRPSAPVLSGTMLTATDGVLHLSTFDYETSARVDVAAETPDPGTVLVSGFSIGYTYVMRPSKALSG